MKWGRVSFETKFGSLLRVQRGRTDTWHRFGVKRSGVWLENLEGDDEDFGGVHCMEILRGGGTRERMMMKDLLCNYEKLPLGF